MNGESEMVTVYRSMETAAEEDCGAIADLLTSEGLAPVILDDTAPGVPEGAWEVQVPSSQVQRAEQLIAENPLPDEVEEVDARDELALSEPIFHSEGSVTAEIEAQGIRSVLEANGIAAILVGDSVLPNFPFEVRVAAEQAERARQVLAEAQQGGPAAAEEGERLSEAQPGANKP